MDHKWSDKSYINRIASPAVYVKESLDVETELNDNDREEIVYSLKNNIPSIL